ncbi:MAG: nucleotidyltransferase substrate binding protein [Thermoguttaceae bacterium]
MNPDDIRWRQRFDHYEKAVRQLEKACRLQVYSELEVAGMVQTFMFTFELAWKTLKDYLFFNGFEVNSPRDAIKKGFEVRLLNEDDAETLLDALSKRNALSHTYDEVTAEWSVRLIKNDYAPVLSRLYATLDKKKYDDKLR